MFYLTNELPEPVGYVTISETEPWGRWLAASIPLGLHRDVRNRLRSNLKHILVGLEMKAALVIPHQLREQGHSLLFEPYAQILHFEFCTGVFSVCEGLGSAQYLVDTGNDGAGGDRVWFNQWREPLAAHVGAEDVQQFLTALSIVQAVRDKLHQDRLGARENIDWHAFSYDAAFVPALDVLQTLFTLNSDRLPAATNLNQ